MAFLNVVTEYHVDFFDGFDEDGQGDATDRENAAILHKYLVQRLEVIITIEINI